MELREQTKTLQAIVIEPADFPLVYLLYFK